MINRCSIHFRNSIVAGSVSEVASESTFSHDAKTRGFPPHRLGVIPGVTLGGVFSVPVLHGLTLFFSASRAALAKFACNSELAFDTGSVRVSFRPVCLGWLSSSSSRGRQLVPAESVQVKKPGYSRFPAPRSCLLGSPVCLPLNLGKKEDEGSCLPMWLLEALSVCSQQGQLLLWTIGISRTHK